MEFLLIMAVFLGLMFFMSNRAKKQQQNQREKLLEQLQPGVGVLTIGGFYGRVVEVDGDVITLESPSGVETIWSKTAIREITEPPFAPVEEDEEEADVVVPDDPSAITGTGTAATETGPTAPGATGSTTGAEPARPAESPVDEDEGGRPDDDGPQTPRR